jgi:hypothetical protein
MTFDQGRFNTNPANITLRQLVGHGAGKIDLSRVVINGPANVRPIRAGGPRISSADKKQQAVDDSVPMCHA